MLYPKSLSVCLSISAEPISSREKPLFCSDLPTVSSPALIKGHQPLMRFCWNMEILFSALAAKTVPRSQLLADFAARGNPFRFNSRVPGGRIHVRTLRNQDRHKGIQTAASRWDTQSNAAAWAQASELGIPLDCTGIWVPNYTPSKKSVSLQHSAQGKTMAGSQTLLCTNLYKIQVWQELRRSPGRSIVYSPKKSSEESLSKSQTWSTSSAGILRSVFSKENMFSLLLTTICFSAGR